MKHTTTPFILGLELALATCCLSACPGEDVTPDDEFEYIGGELVISEIMANPSDDIVWFEIYNATSETRDLQGMRLVYSAPDGTGVDGHEVARSLEVPAGGYVVVAGILDELALDSDHIDYGFGQDLGDFTHSKGRVAIYDVDTYLDETNFKLIDETSYLEDSGKDVSRAFDGSQAPDAIANDDPAFWCPSSSEFSAGVFATPGEANDPCGSATTCMDNGAAVDIVFPQVGDLVLNEIHANPGLSEEGDGEWFELLVTADVHLNGLEIGKVVGEDAEGQILGGDCIAVSAGDYVVVAASSDPAVNGMLPPEAIVGTLGFDLKNSDGALWIGSQGALLDAVTWGSTGNGTATQLDMLFADIEQNDTLEFWCDADQAFGLGDMGTPGAANTSCPIEAIDGECIDPDTMEWRDIVPVDQGDLIITEYMSNPEAVAEGDGEWFEITALGAGDLNGMEFGKGGEVEGSVLGAECIEVTAGMVQLFAREADPEINGGLPEVDHLFSFALNNSNGDLFIGYGGEVWDAVSWASRPAGKSMSLDPVADPELWCEGAGVYGLGDEGTPGESNDPCGGGPMGQCLDPQLQMLRNVVPPVLGDMVINEIMPDPNAAPDAGGEWFEVYAAADFDLNGVQVGKGGELEASTVTQEECVEISAGTYMVFAKNGDPMENGGLPEVDLVFVGISLSNSNSNVDIGYNDVILDSAMWSGSSAGVAHSLDPDSKDPALNDDADDLPWCESPDQGTPGAANPMCGGGMMEGQCFDGGEPRDIVFAGQGDLIITEYMANPDAVDDADGEWFEIRALSAVDLNGVDVGKAFPTVLDTIEDSDCIALSPGDTALIARNGNTMTNGGLPPVDFVSSMSLTNSNSSLFLAREGELIDAVTWTSVTAGDSESLDPGSYDAVANDEASAWCNVDLGTPKADNPGCP